MRVLIQKAKNASCKVKGKTTGKIDFGLVVFVGFTENDNKDTILWMANKVLNLRIFEDENGVMNKSLLDVGGSILSISQFTLYADCSKGNRPSYMKALRSDKSELLYAFWNQKLSEIVKTETGVFGGDMEISLTNLGPTTIFLER